jgi:hypothetical protein
VLDFTCSKPTKTSMGLKGFFLLLLLLVLSVVYVLQCHIFILVLCSLLFHANSVVACD